MVDRLLQPSLTRTLAVLAVLCVLLPSHRVRAGLSVEAQLSAQEVRSGQPVELILTARSSEGPLEAPQLSALELDFQILDRRVERRRSVTNGTHREELRMRLVLLPRRAGKLVVPGLAFDSARTQSLSLRVEGNGQDTPGEVASTASSALLDPGLFEPRGAVMSVPFHLDPYPSWSADVPPGPAPLTRPPLEPPTQPSAPKTLAPRGVQPMGTDAPVEPLEAEGTTLENPWFWISLGLAIVVAGVLGGRGRSARVPSAQRRPGVPLELPPADPLQTAVDRVRAAYQRGDGNGAREALLSWGRLRWPQDPPGNLGRLAGRCPPPLRDHINQLEKAFFSPDPLHWDRHPVPEGLMAQSSAPTEDAAPASVLGPE